MTQSAIVRDYVESKKQAYKRRHKKTSYKKLLGMLDKEFAKRKPTIETLCEALERAEDSITYDSEELANEGAYALPHDVIVEIKHALASAEPFRRK